ncbi:MAG: reverse transcriptase domain-containing protein, partial [bacterium]
SKLKNWRPISLLSCLYKVISRALNNRLKKVSGFIFSRAQKGFTLDRHIQEVIMNVIEMISHCNSNALPGAILSIDQAKAFGSVSHLFMHQVYRFFGFGPNFIRLLETLGNGRTACIAFEDGTFSPDFNLECGRAQGNTSS